MRKQSAVLVITILLMSGIFLAAQFNGTGSFAAAEQPATNGDIIFAHANHEDVDCAVCHADIEQSGTAADRNFASMETCADCHDVEDDEGCGTCHRNPDDPGESLHPPRDVVFSHKNHLGRGAKCGACHGEIATSTQSLPEHMPAMSTCYSCHDSDETQKDCQMCHGGKRTLAGIHPAQWRNQHGARAALDREWCKQCHQEQSACLDCHRGDNLSGGIHDLNYLYTHGLDAKSKRFECSRCHDNQTFCVGCHEGENRIPLLHSTLAWLTDHGRAARRDVENCAACHDSGDPTCARAGCHLDADGVRGTDPRFHAASMLMFDAKGPWHGDDGYFCFRCHTNTHGAGLGFCGYCHSEK